VNAARDQLLPGARLSGDEHTRPRRSNSGNLLHDEAHCPAAEDEDARGIYLDWRKPVCRSRHGGADNPLREYVIGFAAARRLSDVYLVYLATSAPGALPVCAFRTGRP
jgi:hypothetical protein